MFTDSAGTRKQKAKNEPDFTGGGGWNGKSSSKVSGLGGQGMNENKCNCWLQKERDDGEPLDREPMPHQLKSTFTKWETMTYLLPKR